MPRVLLGNLEPIVRLGLATVLREHGVEIVEENGRQDAVVLDIANPASRSLGERIRRLAPESTIVFWSRDEELMAVLAPGASEARRVPAPGVEDLCGAVTGRHLERA